jgi:hypothetical protein
VEHISHVPEKKKVYLQKDEAWRFLDDPIAMVVIPIAPQIVVSQG